MRIQFLSPGLRSVSEGSITAFMNRERVTPPLQNLLMRPSIRRTLLLALVTLAPPALAVVVEPTFVERRLSQQIIDELETRHLAADGLFEARRPQVGAMILDAIDPTRSLLTTLDFQDFNIDSLPNAIERGHLEEAYRLYGLMLERSETRLNQWLATLEQGPDAVNLNDVESLILRDQDTPWLISPADLPELWRLQLENQMIGLLLADRDPEDTVKALIRRFESQKNRLEQTRPDDVFAAVINAYASAYDPHTNYLPPADSESFNINMSLSLQGIGAVLQTEDEFTKVVNLIPGGPAELDGRLKPADRILGVAQDDEPMEDVVGWRLDEVVQLIRGPKGSQVRLEVQASDDAPHREIVLIRDRVQLEEQSAKQQTLDLGSNQPKIGVITIPTFYSDFEAKQAGDPNYRSTTRDVKRLLGELSDSGVDGIVIDLRNNGGGSLQEAYELFGLFIRRGPVVQIQSAGGRNDVRGDRDSEIAWSGSMAVLVNRLSASASEIFAGAVQDYGRGLVLGSQTFGKGTVQALIPVADGQLKLTIAKFFRISGESTQHKGVIPDIAFPSAIDPTEIGESALDTALPWNQIRSLRYTPLDTPRDRIPELLRRHQQRLSSDPDLIALNEQTALALQLSSVDQLPLQLDLRRQERERANQSSLEIENRRRAAKGLPMLTDIDAFEADTGDEDASDNGAQDAALMEASRILVDDLMLIQRLAGS